ncbi:rod shape-determining protein MreD [Streptomyces rubellomurinus]|uniref:Rod shape-determining protein MreD n=2 Tax=Streptomyces TaxID=1883 RepID=A0A0F2TI34_STRR3|nr:rod shape-determining protein MreD [Streptomyces rubellomurinus]KJS53371.1 rod shape-determining protein MreD [Streptomyces rubellomurinus subsp. indigoferus]KJS61382.1 rod shape-determining protein MreD [Streptomyces rubellomurinus]
MRLARIPVSAVLTLLGLILQVSVFGRLQLPGATPDILLLVVVGLAMVYGPTGGCLVGFSAGLLADLAPPSDHAIGRYALVLCLMGYAAGLLRPEHGRQRSVSSALLVVGAAAIASTLLYAMVGALVGDTAARHVGLGGLVISALLYDLLLAPFVVPLVMLLGRRFGRDPVAAASGDDDTGGPGLGSLARYRTTRDVSAGPTYKKRRVPGFARRP